MKKIITLACTFVSTALCSQLPWTRSSHPIITQQPVSLSALQQKVSQKLASLRKEPHAPCCINACALCSAVVCKQPAFLGAAAALHLGERLEATPCGTCCLVAGGCALTTTFYHAAIVVCCSICIADRISELRK